MYGLTQFTNLERGKTFWSKLIALVTWLWAHTHNGVNSALITWPAIVKDTQTILAAAWGAPDANGIYAQTITVPAGRSYSNDYMKFNIMNGTTEGDLFYPETEKITDVSYYIYCNDNTIGIKVRYL
jgi:hypothetical protein